MRNEPCEVASVSISTINSKLDVMNITSKKYFETADARFPSSGEEEQREKRKEQTGKM